MEGENLDRVCLCGARSTLTTGWKSNNPGRRFWGCGNYGKKVNICNYFVWHDPPVHNQSRVVIVGLLKKISTMERGRRNESMRFLSERNNGGGHPSNIIGWWKGLAWPWNVDLRVDARLGWCCSMRFLSEGNSGGRHPSNIIGWWKGLTWPWNVALRGGEIGLVLELEWGCQNGLVLNLEWGYQIGLVLEWCFDPGA
ncbi:hypothetical protein V6N12_023621 [Hibiscus sabdariffa]|uniref:GRF-type domain-containing protein n=1 Tax=Hibiscus sabdariffa TaxID=183260 RepID=A0ABR2FY84_9ROSI